MTSKADKDKPATEQDQMQSDSVFDSGVKEIPVSGGDSAEDTAESSTTAEDAAEEVDPVAALEAKVQELEDKNLRTLADYDNYRKRSLRQVDDLVRSANDQILTELLDVVDNFERALDQEVEISEDHHKALAAFRQGTELIYGQLKAVLEKFQVKAIESLGHPFDPNLHEAMMQVDSDEFDEGIIASEVSRGYMIEDRVLRHARVAVSKGPSTQEEAD